MDVEILQRHFARIGARVQVRSVPPKPNRGVVLDIAHDRQGEVFDIQVVRDRSSEIDVLHVESRQRHLLVLTRDEADQKHKFLCGHDERHWFVAAVPENRSVSTVGTAMEALKPVRIQALQRELRVRPKDRNRRRNEVFVRQGEWFFVPARFLTVRSELVLRNEPLRRGNGKPHRVDYLYRIGGETVYVCRRMPRGLNQVQYATLMTRQPSARTWAWRTFRRDPIVFVKGHVRHADHATIELRDWHQVMMNTETESSAMRHLAFLD